MSLNISETSNASAQHGLARPPAQSGHGIRRPTGQVPEGADAAPKPRNLADNAENTHIRAHPAAATDDSLQRLPESHEHGAKGKTRVRKDSAPSDRSDPAHAATRKPSTPYDAPGAKSRHLDILA
jgi:hypothetical protein